MCRFGGSIYVSSKILLHNVKFVIVFNCFSNIAGWGADNKSIVAILGHRNVHQRQQIRKAYEELFEEDLIKRLESEISGDFEVFSIQTHTRSDSYKLINLF